MRGGGGRPGGPDAHRAAPWKESSGLAGRWPAEILAPARARPRGHRRVHPRPGWQRRRHRGPGAGSGDRGGGGATYLGHITAQPDHKSVNKVRAEAWRLWRRGIPRPGKRRDQADCPRRPRQRSRGGEGHTRCHSHTPTGGRRPHTRHHRHVLLRVRQEPTCSGTAAGQGPQGNKSVRCRGAGGVCSAPAEPQAHPVPTGAPLMGADPGLQHPPGKHPWGRTMLTSHGPHTRPAPYKPRHPRRQGPPGRPQAQGPGRLPAADAPPRQRPG